MSYLRYALEPVFLALRDVRSPDNERCSQVLVLRITDKEARHYETGLSRYAEELYCGMHFVPFEDHIYAGYPGEGKIWKWAGTNFEAATPEELRAFDAAKAVAKAASYPTQFDNVDGWSMRGGQSGLANSKNPLMLDGQPVTVVSSGESWPPQPLSVVLIRPGQNPQTIWTFDGRPNRVSRAEYERLFGE